MEQRTQWCLRRVRRTWWLLSQDETRVETARYLAVHAFGYARSFGQEALRSLNEYRVRTPRAR